MEELNNKIIEYMTQFRDNNDLQKIMHLLNPSEKILKLTIERLLMAGENGLLDFKISIFNPLFSFIINTKNNRPEIVFLQDQVNAVSGALLVIFIQKQCTRKEIDNVNIDNSEDEERKKEISLDNIEDIITEINKSIVIDTKINKNKYIKNILHYVKELDDIKKAFSILLINLASNKKEAYKKNFYRIIKKIENIIKENYSNFLLKSKDSSDEESNRLTPGSLNTLTPILNVQIETLIKIYITLRFALKQKDGINKIIFPLIMEKNNLKSLFEKEEIIVKNLFENKTEDKKDQKKMISRINKFFCNEVLKCLRGNMVKTG